MLIFAKALTAPESTVLKPSSGRVCRHFQRQSSVVEVVQRGGTVPANFPLTRGKSNAEVLGPTFGSGGLVKISIDHNTQTRKMVLKKCLKWQYELNMGKQSMWQAIRVTNCGRIRHIK